MEEKLTSKFKEERKFFLFYMLGIIGIGFGAFSIQKEFIETFIPLMLIVIGTTFINLALDMNK